jgi:hypothetical protein
VSGKGLRDHRHGFVCSTAISTDESPHVAHALATPPDWGVQLVGDRSEIKALAVYRQLQKKHEAILGSYEPVIIRTTVKVSAVPIWSRVRIGAVSREAAQTCWTRQFSPTAHSLEHSALRPVR